MQRPDKGGCGWSRPARFNPPLARPAGLPEGLPVVQLHQLLAQLRRGPSACLPSSTGPLPAAPEHILLGQRLGRRIGHPLLTLALEAPLRARAQPTQAGGRCVLGLGYDPAMGCPAGEAVRLAVGEICRAAGCLPPSTLERARAGQPSSGLFAQLYLPGREDSGLYLGHHFDTSAAQLEGGADRAVRVVLGHRLLSPGPTELLFELRLITEENNGPARAATRLLKGLDRGGTLARGSVLLPAGGSYALGPVESGRVPCAVLCDGSEPLALIGRTHAIPSHRGYRLAPIVELRGGGESEAVMERLRQLGAEAGEEEGTEGLASEVEARLVSRYGGASQVDGGCT